jgi:hypothetical protein
VAEELVLQKRVGNGGAVERDERRVLARAQGVDGVRKQLFPRAAFPLEEHGGVRGRSLLERRRHLLEALRFAHNPRQVVALGHLLLQKKVLVQKPLLAHGAPDDGEEALDVHGFFQEIHGAALDGAHGVAHRAVGRHHDHGRGRVYAARRLEHLEAVLFGKPQIGEHEAKAARLEALERRRPVGRLLDAVALAPQRLDERLAQARLVLDDENVHGLARL